MWSSLSIMWAHFCPSASRVLAKAIEVNCCGFIFLIFFCIFFFQPHPHTMMNACGTSRKIAISDEHRSSRFLNSFCTCTPAPTICMFFFILNANNNNNKKNKIRVFVTKRHSCCTLHTTANYSELPLTLMSMSLDCGRKLQRTHTVKGELNPVNFLQ